MIITHTHRTLVTVNCNWCCCWQTAWLEFSMLTWLILYLWVHSNKEKDTQQTFGTQTHTWNIFPVIKLNSMINSLWISVSAGFGRWRFFALIRNPEEFISCGPNSRGISLLCSPDGSVEMIPLGRSRTPADVSLPGVWLVLFPVTGVICTVCLCQIRSVMTPHPEEINQPSFSSSQQLLRHKDKTII